MTTLYSLRTNPSGEFTILKFDRDYNLESLYALTASSCTCPRGALGKPCRHRKLLPEFIAKGHTNDGWFLDWDTRLWKEPIASERSEPTGAKTTGLKAEQREAIASCIPISPAYTKHQAPEPSREGNGAFSLGEEYPPSPERPSAGASGIRVAEAGGHSIKRRKIA